MRRETTRPPLSSLLALAVGGAGFGVLCLTLTVGSDHEHDRALVAVVELLVGWSFIGTGLFAWWRRPANRTGPLMTAVGFAWFGQTLSAANSDLLFTIGIALDSLFPGIAVHLVLAFPTGRLEERAERWVVAWGYFVVTVLQVPALLFESDQPDDLHNLLVVRPDQALSDRLDALQFAAALALAVASGVLIVRRWRAASPPQRRVLAPVVWTGGLALAAFVIAKGFDAAGSPQHVLELLSEALLATVPFGFLAGLLRSRLAQATAMTDLVGRLGQAPTPDALRAVLADTLGDPSVALAYWLPDSGRFVDAEGRPTDLPDGGWTEVQRGGERIGAIVHDRSLADEPQLARGIHPAVLTDRGLGPALQGLADRAPLPVALAGHPPDDLPPPVATAIYFVVAEALTNVAKYAQAGEAVVRVERAADRMVVEVADDGIGGAQVDRGSGLRGLSDRVAALDGRLEVESPPGAGTRLRVELPTGDRT